MIMTIDIGGTKTMWSLWEKNDLIEKEQYPTETIDDFTQFIETHIHGKQIESLCFALAGPVIDSKFELTNTGQIIDLQEIRARFPQIGQLSFLNDLEALAHSLPHLKNPGQLETFRKGSPWEGARAILSIGTGLGISAVSREGIVLPSEGGHVDFAPRSAEQHQLLDFLEKKYGHVSYERILAGQGLSHLYEFITGKANMLPAKVSEAARNGDDDACKVFTLFTEILATACGNFALTFMASGGIYLGGGMAPKILPLIDKEIFEKTFTDKGRFSQYLNRLPIYVIMDETAPSIGAASYCRRLSTRT